MTTNATAAHSPECPSDDRTWSPNVSLWLTASLAAVVENRISSASRPVDAAITAPRSRVLSASARPAARPAGSHATAIRSSGCELRCASSSSGSAPRTDGPWASR
jgi:hypothetical protein